MKRVKKNSAIYILLVLFIGNAAKPDFFEQLEKIPQLLEHYKHHVKEEGENISFYKFLVLHYDENSTHQQEENHDNLPLYNHCSNHCIAVVLTELVQPIFNQPNAIQPTKSYLKSHYIFIGTTDIFQPPKTA